MTKTTDWCLEATKTLCQYIWDTYGRFPATMDPMQSKSALMWVVIISIRKP